MKTAAGGEIERKKENLANKSCNVYIFNTNFITCYKIIYVIFTFSGHGYI